MYHQAWPWGATASASPTPGFVQPTASTPVATTQWPAGYSQYTVTPEMQQQWAAWASQAQYAYSSNVPVPGDPQTTAAFSGAYPDYQTTAGSVTATEVKKTDEALSTTEKPKSSAEQPIMSQELAESDKIKQLKEQAEKWTSLQQPSASSWSSTAAANTAAPSTNTTTVTAPNDPSKTLTSTNVTQSNISQSQMSKEEEEFERQFKDWEKQFEAWKQQNQNHPDKEAFAQYEKQWQEWRTQLLQKKEQMQKAKAEQMASTVTLQSSTSGSVASFVNTQTNSTNITDPAASTSTTAMYYQHPQYMYMQPYLYPPGTTAVAPPTIPQTAVVPPAVMPPTMVPPGVPPVSMPPAVMPSSVASQQMQQFTMPPGSHGSYAGQPPHMGMGEPPRSENMNYDNQGQEFENEGEMYNYGHPRGNGSRDDGLVPPGYEVFDASTMPPEGDFGRENWKFARGRGRGGRGRARGRGRGESRWSDASEVDARPGVGRTPRKTLLPGGPGSVFTEDADGPPPFEYPTEDCRDDFEKRDVPFLDDRPPGFNFRDGPQQFPQDDPFHSEPFDEHYPPDQEFSDGFPPDKRFPHDRKRFGPNRDRFPDHGRFPPDPERFPPGREGFPPGRRDGFPPEREGFPPNEERFSRGQDRFPPDRERFPPGDERFSRNERFGPDNERFPPNQDNFPPDQEGFSSGQEGFPPKGGRFSKDNNRFPPEDERFARRHMMDEGGFGGDFDQFNPDNEMYGPHSFRDDFPPFDDRGNRGGRGRYSGRGRRFRGEFDRFAPPYGPRMRNDFPPEFPPQPDDRFGFPGDGPRMPPRGMRPQFEPPPFGPEGRFPDEPPFFGDGPDRFKSVDYTHRPASAVMGDGFNAPYEFESEFQDDVDAFRARPAKRKKRDAQRKSTVEKKKDKDKESDKDKENNKDKSEDEDEDIEKDIAKDD